MKPPIIVTGCQRSGTGIVTRILAQQFNLEILGNRDLYPHELDKLTSLLNLNISQFIVQMPIALNCYITIFHKYPEVHFVGFVRDTEEIVNSMKRIKWMMDEFYHWPDFLYDSVEYMKGQWELLKKIIPDTSWTEVEYRSFKDHPLFIPDNQRKTFTVNQYYPDKPVGPRFWTKNNINF